MSIITEGSLEIIERLEREIEDLKKENAILYKDRNEAFKLWDDHKWKLGIAVKALEDLRDGKFLDFHFEVAREALVKINEK